MAVVPALPDSERRTRASISASTGPVSIDFAIYGNGTDYADWVEVWDDGVKLTATTDWTLDSPSGSLATLERPITDARITFTAARSGTIDIVGADKPQRTSQATEGQGVTARAFNQLYTHVVARLREFWDQRVFRAPPGETVPMTLPASADRAGKYFKWDSDGNPSYEAEPDLGGGTLTNNAVSNAYLRDSAACSVIGRSANSSGDPDDIAAASNDTFLGRVSNALGYFTVTQVIDRLASTRGMLLLRGASAWAGLAIGTSGYVLTSDGTDAAWAAPTAQLPRGYIDGCILSNNSSDATNDIDFAAGVCRDSTNAVNITCAAMTKQLDADWAAGTAAGMRYSGAAITDTTYHLFAIAKADGTQDYFAYSAVDPTAVLPAGYLYFRRIGSILRESAAIVGFTQSGDEFLRNSSVQDYSATNPGTSAVTVTLKTPLGTKNRALIRGYIDTTTSNFIYFLITSPDETDATPAADNACRAGKTGGITAPIYDVVRTNTSSQIRYRQHASGVSDTVSIVTRGWIDRRGKDA